MSIKRRHFAAIATAAGATAAIAIPAVAVAEPVWPVAGAEPADQTINDLAAAGYAVRINWVGGYSDVSLSQCSVKGIHNPDGPPTAQQPNATVYVDVDCPGNNFD
jgi:hypothetical protein